jgi:hypothetical protein
MVRSKTSIGPKLSSSSASRLSSEDKLEPSVSIGLVSEKWWTGDDFGIGYHLLGFGLHNGGIRTWSDEIIVARVGPSDDVWTATVRMPNFQQFALTIGLNCLFPLITIRSPTFAFISAPLVDVLTMDRSWAMVQFVERTVIPEEAGD